MAEAIEDEDEGDEEVKYEEAKQAEKSKFAKAAEIEFDDDEELEAADEVPADINAVKTSIEDMHLGHDPAALAKKMQLGDGRAAPVKAVHNFHVPQSEGMGGLPKPPSGSKPFTQPTSKYDPLPWTDFYDSTEILEDKMPIYYAGSGGHVFLCLHGAGHSAMSFAALAKILKSEPYNSTCVSFDFRGHGGHYCEDETDMRQ